MLVWKCVFVGLCVDCTFAAVQKSRIGMATNTLRKKCDDSNLSSFAKKLIKSWKKLLPGLWLGVHNQQLYG